MNQVQQLREQLLAIAKMGSALALLGWDQEVNLPPKGLAIRGQVGSMLAAEFHRKATNPELIKLVEKLAVPKVFGKLSLGDRVIVREALRDVRRAQKLPVNFVEQFSALTTDAFGAWVDARKKSDFKIFEPYLQKVVRMSRRQADYIGYEASPYDALLDAYEPGMTEQKLDDLFGPLTKELSRMIASHKQSVVRLPKLKYPLITQQQLNERVAQDIGYDLEAGRIDASPHPFTINFHPTDVRITTRYDEGDFWISLGSVIHEVGHALYEQGLPAKDFGTPLAEAVSLGIHESQSRLWENFVGRSEAFSDYLYPLLIQHFGKLPYDKKQLHASFNKIRPSLIRVEADEVTYNLHIAVRYELEKALISGQLEVADLPDAWNQKMRDYLGVKVPNDANGVLQDVHWSHGSFGYFPTYSLGNMYAAQIFNKISHDIPGLDKQIAAGNFTECLNWLRRNIHVRGKRLSADDLIKKISGEPLNADYLVEHLRQKIS